MFSRLSLIDSFRHVASDEEWAAFTGYGKVTSIDLWIDSMAEGVAYSGRSFGGYHELWTKLAAIVRDKLLAGAWRAEGFRVEHGGQPLAIDSHLWRLLELDIMKEAAVGAGFEFVNLLISSEEPDRATVNHLKAAAIRMRLRRWLEDLAASGSGPMTREEVYAAACSEFAPETINRHMMATVWKQAELPERFRHKGRPGAAG
jgi:hypothetical protein